MGVRMSGCGFLSEEGGGTLSMRLVWRKGRALALVMEEEKNSVVTQGMLSCSTLEQVIRGMAVAPYQPLAPCHGGTDIVSQSLESELKPGRKEIKRPKNGSQMHRVGGRAPPFK